MSGKKHKRATDVSHYPLFETQKFKKLRRQDKKHHCNNDAHEHCMLYSCGEYLTVAGAYACPYCPCDRTAPKVIATDASLWTARVQTSVWIRHHAKRLNCREIVSIQTFAHGGGGWVASPCTNSVTFTNMGITHRSDAAFDFRSSWDIREPRNK